MDGWLVSCAYRKPHKNLPKWTEIEIRNQSVSRARQKTVGRHRNNILRESVAVGGAGRRRSMQQEKEIHNNCWTLT